MQEEMKRYTLCLLEGEPELPKRVKVVAGISGTWTMDPESIATNLALGFNFIKNRLGQKLGMEIPHRVVSYGSTITLTHDDVVILHQKEQNMKRWNAIDITIYQPTRIDETARIGRGTKIGAFCDIGEDVIIGKNCNIQCHVAISNGCIIGDKVFIGPNSSLLSDKYIDETIIPVIVEDTVKIGGHCVILPGVKVREYAFIGAGSVVTKNVKKNSRVFGVPAVQQELV